MTDVLDPAPIIEAAQQAAAAGDYPEAEQLLRKAAAIQEVSLGSLHPDLATTLNNLALLCERTNKYDEAERGYRRAHAIAVASLSPGHPFIATSLKNLVDFCAVHRIPIWKPPASRSDDDPSYPEPEAEAQPEPGLAVYRPGRRWPPRTIALATLAVAVVVAVAFVVQGRGTTDTSDPLPQAEDAPSAGDSPAASATTPALPLNRQPTVTLERRADTPAPVERSEASGDEHHVGCERAERSVVQCPRKERFARLAVRVSERRSATWHVHFLHATADEGGYDRGASLVPRRTRASGHAASCGRESRHWVSDVQ